MKCKEFVAVRRLEKRLSDKLSPLFCICLLLMTRKDTQLLQWTLNLPLANKQINIWLKSWTVNNDPAHCCHYPDVNSAWRTSYCWNKNELAKFYFLEIAASRDSVLLRSWCKHTVFSLHFVDNLRCMQLLQSKFAKPCAFWILTSRICVSRSAGIMWNKDSENDQTWEKY